MEEKVLSIFPVRPRLYKRYVDDIIVIWDAENGPYSVLLDLLNAQHEDIMLTTEDEVNATVPFLDLLITRPHLRVNGTPQPYSLAVYRKPTHGNRYLHFDLSHPFTLKRHVFRGLWLQAEQLLRNHPRQRAAEIDFLCRVFIRGCNGYPPVVIRRWLCEFGRELQRKPALLNLPIRTNKNRPVNLDISAHLTNATGIDSQSQQLDEMDQEVPQGDQPTPWVPTLICPYIPGVSERLRSLAARFGVRNWLSYSGKLSENFGTYKEQFHSSKSRFAVYALDCSCGAKYVGESGRNLKIRVREHKRPTSKSALSVHIREARDDHTIEENSTTVLTQEKNLCKRRFMESAVIKAKSRRLCNNGPSVYVSDTWNPSIAKLARSLSVLD